VCVCQNVYVGERYGAVTLLISYRRSDQRLRVEVLNAVNLLPMDSNGKQETRGEAESCDRHLKVLLYVRIMNPFRDYIFLTCTNHFKSPVCEQVVVEVKT